MSFPYHRHGQSPEQQQYNVNPQQQPEGSLGYPSAPSTPASMGGYPQWEVIEHQQQQQHSMQQDIDDGVLQYSGSSGPHTPYPQTIQLEEEILQVQPQHIVPSHHSPVDLAPVSLQPVPQTRNRTRMAAAGGYVFRWSSLFLPHFVSQIDANGTKSSTGATSYGWGTFQSQALALH